MASNSNTQRSFVTYPSAAKKVNRESNISPSQEESSSSVSSAGLPSDERGETAPSRTQADSQAVAAKIPQTVLKANPLSASNNADGVLQGQARAVSNASTANAAPKNGDVPRNAAGVPLNGGGQMAARVSIGNANSSVRSKSAADTGSVPVPRKVSLPASSVGAGATPGKRVVMRLKCKYRPLHDSYFQSGIILDQETDVVFMCGDGGRVKGHRIILASSSKFFTDIFSDQRPDEVTTVHVPGVRSDVMKLILMLAYKEKVILTKEQIHILKESADTFGINLNSFKEESVELNTKLDVKPAKVMDSLPSKSVPPPMVARPHNPPHQQSIQQQQQRRLLPPNGRGGHIRLITSKPNQQLNIPRQATFAHYESDEDTDGSESYTFQLQGYDEPRSHHHPKQPRVETERDEMDDFDLHTDPVQAQNMIEEWMAKVGQDDRNQGNSSQQRSRFNQNYSQEQGNFECTVCKITFVKEKSWKWHEDRHVGLGLFKCSQCDVVLKTARAVWSHEQSVHSYASISMQDLEEPRAIPPNFQVVENRRHFMGSAALNARLNMAKQAQQTVGMKNSAALRMAQFKKLKAAKMASPMGMKRSITDPRLVFQQDGPQRASLIGIGHSMGSESLDIRKIKQLHWLYVCAKCDNCSDSSQKAMIHYSKCYPNEEVPFEATVTKYRQGFYGKIKCPLCPRKYAANGGFMIHCGHMHTEYRRLFSHTGAVEDKIKCVNCQRKFSFPDEFHDHLDSGLECTKSPINEESMPLLTSGRSGAAASGTGGDKLKRRTNVSARSSPAPKTDDAPSPISAKPPTPAKSTPLKPSPPPPQPPRSARLANRASLAKSKSLAKAQQEEEDQINFNKRIGTTKRRASSIEYPPVDCPICGASEISNISLHMANDHEALKVSINRISTELLRCRKCLITIAICDLLGHSKTCTSTEDDPIWKSGSSPFPDKPASEPDGQDSSSESKQPIVVDINNLPPGVGASPIDRIENTDLFSKETLKKALVCGVCGKKALKFGEIGTCLKAHGIVRCVLCFNSYCNKADYSAHLKMCHGQLGPRDVLKLKCPLCNKLFVNAGQVASHMYSNHWTGLLKETRLELENGENLNETKGSSDSASEVETEGTQANDFSEKASAIEADNDEIPMETDEVAETGNDNVADNEKLLSKEVEKETDSTTMTDILKKNDDALSLNDSKVDAEGSNTIPSDDSAVIKDGPEQLKTNDEKETENPNQDKQVITEVDKNKEVLPQPADSNSDIRKAE